MEHPTRAQWSAFLDGRLETAARHGLAVHLDDCQAGLDLLISLPAPVYRALGRPVCPWLPLDPPELERQVAGLLKLCEERRASGEAVNISAEWTCESLLLTVLSLAWVRLMRQGHTVQVLGVVFGSPIPPARPETDFAFLVGAGVYRNAMEWGKVLPGRLAVLAGGPGSQADMTLPNPKGGLSVQKLRPYAEAINSALHSGDPIQRQAALCCALGCDLPPGFFPGVVPAPFVHLQDPLTDAALAWTSVNGGLWLAREVLWRDPPRDLDSQLTAATGRLRSLGPEGVLLAQRVTAGSLPQVGSGDRSG